MQGALETFNKLTTDQNFVEENKIWLITQKEVSIGILPGNSRSDLHDSQFWKILDKCGI